MKKLRIVLNGNVCVLAIVDSVVEVGKNKYEIVGDIVTILTLRNALYECGIFVEMKIGTSGNKRSADLETFGREVEITFEQII